MILWYLFILIIAVLSSIFLVLKFFTAWKEKSVEFYKYCLLLFWLILGVGLFGFYNKSIYDYYYSFIFPLPFLLVAFFISSFYKLRLKFFPNKTFKILSIFIFVIIIVLNIENLPLKYEHSNQVNQTETISKFILSQTEKKPFNFALITDPPNYDMAYRYFFTVLGHPPVTIQDSAQDPQRKTITDQLFVVCESLSCEPVENSLWEIASFGRADIAGKWNISVVQVYKLVHYKGK